MEKNNNPIKVISINEKDYKKLSFEGFGDATVFGDGATREVREILSKQVDTSIDFFNEQFLRWPGLAGTLKVTLKEEALAKSHRPLSLFSLTSCPIIGTLDFGEIIVSATDRGLSKLKSRLLNGTAKKVIANISAIEKIEPFSITDRLNGVDANLLSSQMSIGRDIKIKLFDHKDEHKNLIVKSSLYDFASKNNIKLKEIKYVGSYGLLTAKLENNSSMDNLSKFIGLRSVSLMPRFSIADFHTQANPVGKADHDLFPPPSPKDDYPIVGVIDSGICPSCSLLSPWIVARESYVPSGYEDYTHGTMVAGLIVNSRSLNFQDDRFPSTQAKIVDVNVFPKDSSISEEDLVAIIEEVVPKYP